MLESFEQIVSLCQLSVHVLDDFPLNQGHSACILERLSPAQAASRRGECHVRAPEQGRRGQPGGKSAVPQPKCPVTALHAPHPSLSVLPEPSPSWSSPQYSSSIYLHPTHTHAHIQQAVTSLSRSPRHRS
ncbi:hypothetical protein SRHO_G00138740 [Serrasalmus rhombeus]